MPCNYYYSNQCTRGYNKNEEEFKGPCPYLFLEWIEKCKQEFPQDKELISSFEEAYMKVWNKYAKSGGKGPATGAVFERWIREQLGNEYKISKKKKADLGAFKFNADIVIPDSENPKVILEVKIDAGPQEVLSGAGVVALSEKEGKQINYGLITLYELSDKENCEKILKTIEKHFPKRFGYFCIGSGWSQTIEKIKEFIKESLNEEKK